MGKKKKGSNFPELERRDIQVSPQLPLNAELAHFIDCVNHGRRPLVSGEDGLVAVKVAEMVRAKISQSG